MWSPTKINSLLLFRPLHCALHSFTSCTYCNTYIVYSSALPWWRLKIIKTRARLIHWSFNGLLPPIYTYIPQEFPDDHATEQLYVILVLLFRCRFVPIIGCDASVSLTHVPKSFVTHRVLQYYIIWNIKYNVWVRFPRRQCIRLRWIIP